VTFLKSTATIVPTADINQRESLSLDSVRMQGFSSPAFAVFDRRQRRITV
jgi:hypothetical protein